MVVLIVHVSVAFISSIPFATLSETSSIVLNSFLLDQRTCKVKLSSEKRPSQRIFKVIWSHSSRV